MASLLVFASCVKDIESASVTNVRNAKAAELTSIAAYNNAMAEAAVITANAEAALKAAQAEYQKAQAELVKAQAELLKVQTEEERTRLELLIVELETAKARSAAELERIAREMELELEQHKLDLFKAQQAYIDYAQQLEEAERARLIAVSGKYTKAVEELIDLQVEKVELEADIAALEAGITNAEEALTKQIEATLSQIQYIDSQIENYKKYLAADQTELVNAIIDATFKKDQAAIAEADAKAVWYNSIDRVNEAWEKVYNGKYMESFLSLREYAFANFGDEEGHLYYVEDGKIGYYKDDVTPVPLFKYAKSISQSVAYNGHSTNVTDYTPAEVYTEGFTEFLDAKAAAATAKHELTVKNLTADKESSQATADAYKKRMDDAYPESLQKEIKEAYDKATEEIEEAQKARVKAVEAYHIAYETLDFNEDVNLTKANNAVTAAQEEYDACKDVVDNMPNTIVADKDAIELAKVRVGQLQGLIDNKYKPESEEADSLVEVYTAKVDSVANVIAAFKLEEKKAAVTKAYYEWQAHKYDKDAAEYEKKYNEAQEAVDAVEQDEKYNQAVGEKQNFQNTLDTKIQEANTCKQDLDTMEEKLSIAVEHLATCTTTLEEHEAALAKAELEIEGLESKLELAQEELQKVYEACDDIYNMYIAALAAIAKVNELYAERDAIAVYWSANIYHISEKYCYMEDFGDYRDIYCSSFVTEVIDILLPGDNLWNDNARSSYIDAFNTCSRSLAYVEVNEKGLELEKAETEKDFAQINDELAFVKTCGELWDSHLNDIDSAKAAQEEYVTDWKAWVDAKIAYTDADAECTALGEILDHDSDIQEKIDALYEVEDALVDEINEMIGILNDASKTLYLMKAKQLPVLEAKIAAQEKLVEKLEAELNALLGE